MNTTQITKSDFIKFNVSPQFKALTERKAEEHGMTVSELGRMLFGAFVTGVARPTLDVSDEFLEMAKQAKRDYEKGLGKTFDNPEDAIAHLHGL